MDKRLESLSASAPTSVSKAEGDLWELAKDVATGVKCDLLQCFANDGVEKLVNGICWVVIQIDLINRPIMFRNEFGAMLISEAFTAMKEAEKACSQYFLAEPLALNAAKVYFIDETAGLVQTHIVGFSCTRRK